MRLNRTLSDRTQSRMEALRAEAEAKQTAGCTFKPKVNTSSVRMVLEKQALQGEECSSRYDRLYSDAQRRLEKQQVVSVWTCSAWINAPIVTCTANHRRACVV